MSFYGRVDEVSSTISALQKARAEYRPKLPKVLRSGRVAVALGSPSAPAADQEEIRRLFPHTYGQPTVTLVEGDAPERVPLKVGVVLSGGQAPGGHNVIVGLLDALKAIHPESRLFGFLKGPGGVIKGQYRELTVEGVSPYRNTGGFDLIMTSRDKIEKPEELQACKKNFVEMGLDGLVIVGGDDSNTNAAILAEYLKAEGCATCIIGVPKTIDGDMKGAEIETSFGYHTATKVYSELIGNIARDAMSAVKYWHFIRLMGRSASHITLECALQTHPNVALISEEVQARQITLEQIVDQLVSVILRRAEAGRNYGVVLVPEGLVEFIGDFRTLIDELSTILGTDETYLHSLPDHSERVQYLNTRLTPESARVYGTLPQDIQEVLLRRDSHGNVPLSQVETERLLIDLVSDKIRLLQSRGEAKAVSFSPLSHFFGYEGRCAPPTNFDADYAYTLGFAAAHLIRARLSGYTVHVRNLTQPADEWVAGGTPVTRLLNLERRRGKLTPVIKKALVDLGGKAFAEFARQRDQWALEDDYVFPGPIQYFGPPEVCDAPPITLALDQAK